MIDIDDIIAELLTGPQRKAVKRLTRSGFDKKAAVRRLFRLGMLVEEFDDLTTDLLFGTRYALREEAVKRPT
jgi:hypothetical protein